jgi:hypothetical protein
MENEIKFKCEICGKIFDAIPETMVECEVDIDAVDEDGNPVELTQEEQEEILAEAIEENAGLKAFSKKVVCMCLECQDQMVKEADEIIELPEEDV